MLSGHRLLLDLPLVDIVVGMGIVVPSESLPPLVYYLDALP